MRKILIAIFAIVVVSCFAFSCVESPSQTQIKQTELPIQQPQSAIQSATIDTAKEPPANRTWISPGKVNIGNFYPSARAEYNISIHNGSDKPVAFNVKYREPSYTADGYSKPMVGTKDWIIIADATPVIAPKATKDVLVVVAMPQNVKNYPMKWEFWISVMESEQVGMVQTELCSRWLVDMR